MTQYLADRQFREASLPPTVRYSPNEFNRILSEAKRELLQHPLARDVRYVNGDLVIIYPPGIFPRGVLIRRKGEFQQTKEAAFRYLDRKHSRIVASDLH